MSKQYLTTHAHDPDSPADVFSLACAPSSLLVASGNSALSIHSTTSSSYPTAQTLDGVHKLGSHHVAVSSDGRTAVSVGFSGEVRLWGVASKCSGAETDDDSEVWEARGEVVDGVKGKAGEVWAVALSADGRYLAGTTFDGRVNVWDVHGTAAAGDQRRANGDAGPAKIREYETKGSFGLCVDISPDGALTATGHVSGSLYIFSNATSRLTHSLPSLHAPVRTVRFSPASTLLVAAGDSGVIGLYAPASGEQVAVLKGHGSWITSLDWSRTGEWLLSGAWDGRVRVWSVERRESVAIVAGPGDEGPVWSVRWLRGVRPGRSEGFVVGGKRGGLRFYREAAGG